MAIADDLARARRASDDQPGSIQRRGTARGPGRRDHAHGAALRPQQLRAAGRTMARSRVGGAVENPMSLTLDDLRACRRTSERSRSNAPGTGASRCDRCRSASHGATTPCRPHAGRAPSCTTCSSRRSPAGDAVDVRFEGADHGAYHLKPVLADTDKDDLSFVRALPLAHAADPAAEILIAYEMNGEPLRLDHGAPFRLDRASLVRRRVGEVAEANRRADRAVYRRVPDRPLHVRVARPPARGRQPHARTCAHHGSRAGVDHQPRHLHACAARPGREPGR